MAAQAWIHKIEGMEETRIIEALLWLAAFVVFWSGGIYLLAYVSGWRRMAAHFATEKREYRRRFFGHSAKIGWVNYNGCLTVRSSPEGIYLAVRFPFNFGQRPMFIPREMIRELKRRKVLWIESVIFEAGSPRVGKIELMEKDFEGLS